MILPAILLPHTNVLPVEKGLDIIINIKVQNNKVLNKVLNVKVHKNKEAKYSM